MNRSRKRKAQMDRIKKERNAKKELLRLKKTLGMLDEHGNELIKKVEDIVEYKTPEQLKRVGFNINRFKCIMYSLIYDLPQIGKIQKRRGGNIARTER